ncbi:MAG: AmmeMemoRadiSam system protein B [Candidatus Omnitrophica bacterium]|nr:AmmeMemoRadiSam system protein B [Candidatus Omnitrophota bacterium]
MIRNPVVSGQFYPSDVRQLEDFINQNKPKVTSKTKAYGMILPHAGYVYSGKVAIETVCQVVPRKKIIILGPKHTSYGQNYSLWAKGKWAFSFGNIDIDEELARLILKNSNLIREDYLAHKFEHSIEVQLPILYKIFGEFKFVPIACELAKLDTYIKLAEEIFSATFRLKEEILFVASTDMTHYEPNATVRRKDRLAIDDIINFDVESLLKHVEKENISMCGVAPVSILLLCLKTFGAQKAQVISYQTSGDVNNDYSSVVGYVGIVIN